MRAVIPMGILMKNAQRQVRVGSLVKYPPKTGPRTAAAPAVAPHIPKATLRALPVKVVVRIDRVAGGGHLAPEPLGTPPPTGSIRSFGEPPPIHSTIKKKSTATKN